MTEREEIVLQAIRDSKDGLTADEFVSSRGLYVNSWAPVFTRLLQRGYTFVAGQRSTSHGSWAMVHRVGERGSLALRGLVE